MRRRSIARFCLIPLAIVSVSIINAAADPAHRFPHLTRTAVQTIPCKPPAVNVSRDASMFSETQEVDLGDAIAEQLVRDVQIIDDDAVAAHLRAIGDRLVRNLPPSSLRFEFFLIEIADVTAFVLP